jgi:YD repeat-containing protein
VDDDSGDLTVRRYPDGTRATYANDAVGTYAYNAANELVYLQDATGRTAFTFDQNGNQRVEQRGRKGDRRAY